MKVNREIVELLEKEVDVKRLVDKLFFSPDDLEAAALKQPTLYLEAGRFRAQSSLELKRLQRKLAKESALKGLKIRQDRKGLTETAIKSRLSTSHTIQDLQTRVDHAEVYEEFAKQLCEAYKERLMVVAVLSRLRASEINSELRSVKNAETVEGMRKRAHKARKALNDLEGGEDDF